MTPLWSDVFRSQCAYTLIEIVVSLAIFTLLLGTFVSIIVHSYRLQTYDVEQGEAVKVARDGVEKLMKELREVKYGDDGSYPLVAGSLLDQSITFFSDIDVDQKTEKVRYFLLDGYLKRGVIEPSGQPVRYDSRSETIENVARYITNGSTPIFRYYDERYPAVQTPLSVPPDVTNVRLVEIRLKVNVTPERAPIEFVQSSFVHLRNLKEEF